MRDHDMLVWENAKKMFKKYYTNWTQPQFDVADILINTIYNYIDSLNLYIPPMLPWLDEDSTLNLWWRIQGFKTFYVEIEEDLTISFAYLDSYRPAFNIKDLVHGSITDPHSLSDHCKETMQHLLSTEPYETALPESYFKYIEGLKLDS